VTADSRFVELYETTFPTVYRAAFLLCRNRSIAEDATQEAFAKAFERWGRIGGEPWVGGWVMTTALNQVRRAYRWRRSVRTEAPADIDLESSLDLWKAIRGLPRRQQEAVVLHYVAALPLDQVAAAMGCRNGTVKTHLSRARQELARYLEVEDDA
jgi:RNA polymerase sigma factor (sigma-70 family)